MSYPSEKHKIKAMFTPVAFLLLIRILIVTDTASVYTTTAETQSKTQLSKNTLQCGNF